MISTNAEPTSEVTLEVISLLKQQQKSDNENQDQTILIAFHLYYFHQQKNDQQI